MLYVIGTSIGNIQDTSYRVAETLCNVDVILAEDTRTFSSYYSRIQDLFGFVSRSDQKVLSYHSRNEFEQLPAVLEMLQKGKYIALVSESGMPAFSDPGQLLIQHVRKQDLEMTVIPGPTAFSTALVSSGLGSEHNVFLGFLPKKTSQLKKLFREYQDKEVTLVAYESPQRINATLQLISMEYPDVRVAVCRELTKKFEEVVVGTADKLAKSDYKGEIAMVLKLTKSR